VISREMKIKISKLKQLIREATMGIDTTGNPKKIDLTWEQVQREFPKAAEMAQEMYQDNLEMGQDDEEPGLQAPAQRKYYLVLTGGFEGHQPSLPAYPDYELMSFDELDVGWNTGQGVEMRWNGEDWDM
jgi:hypothetical protein